MAFFQQFVFYCLLGGTGYLAIHYIYAAIFKVSYNNPYFIKQVFAFTSFLVMAILYKSLQVGELNSEYISGIKWVILSWIPYILVTVGYVLLTKILR
jgi:hypothetical protein